MKHSALLSTIAVLPLARGVAFGGPAPTPVEQNNVRAMDSFAPNPTKGPSVAELRKRANLNSRTCGFVDADWFQDVTCENFGATCMMYSSASLGMVGCCTGSDTQNCGWASSCVDYSAYAANKCDSGCMANQFNLICSNTFSQYCITWSYAGLNVVGYGCTDTQGLVQTVQSFGTDSFSSTYSVSVPVLSGNAVDPSASASGSSYSFGFGYSAGGSSGGGSHKKKTKAKVNVKAIVGAVVGALAFIGLAIAAVIVVCIKKKKSSKQLAPGQQAAADAQASQPLTAYPPQTPMQPQTAYPPQPPMQQQQPFAPPMPPQSPQPPYGGGYFMPQDQKSNPQTQVHEYGMQSPISNPPTPAPAYTQPYYAGPNIAPQMPTQSPVPYQTREPAQGMNEANPLLSSQPPTHQPMGQGQNNAVYEMGGHR